MVAASPEACAHVASPTRQAACAEEVVVVLVVVVVVMMMVVVVDGCHASSPVQTHLRRPRLEGGLRRSLFSCRLGVGGESREGGLGGKRRVVPLEYGRRCHRVARLEERRRRRHRVCVLAAGPRSPITPFSGPAPTLAPRRCGRRGGALGGRHELGDEGVDSVRVGGTDELVHEAAPEDAKHRRQ